MKRNKMRKFIPLLVFAVIFSACTPAPVAGPTATVDVNPIYTSAAQTLSAETTLRAALMPTNTATLAPTQAPTAEPATATSEVGTTALVLATELPTRTPLASSGDYSYPTIHSTVNTNCRSGPGMEYEVVGALMPDQKSEVHGISRAGGYWYILNPNGSPKYCWVWMDTTVVEGNTNYLPYIEIPPTPGTTPKISASVSVSPVTTACNTTLTFTGTITSSEAAIVSFEWVREDGTVSNPGRLIFSDDGTQTVTTTYTIKSTTDGWVYLRILSPVTLKSNRATFSIIC